MPPTPIKIRRVSQTNSPSRQVKPPTHYLQIMSSVSNISSWLGYVMLRNLCFVECKTGWKGVKCELLLPAIQQFFLVYQILPFIFSCIFSIQFAPVVVYEFPFPKYNRIKMINSKHYRQHINVYVPTRGVPDIWL